MPVEVCYKCRCMLAEVVVVVPFRAVNQDVVEWVGETVGGVISRDHRRRSPLCEATVMEYAKIPAPENAPHLGGRPVIN